MNVNLKEERIKRELTQFQMACEMGVGYNTYVTWETGRAKPNFENELKIKKFLEENK